MNENEYIGACDENYSLEGVYNEYGNVEICRVKEKYFITIDGPTSGGDQEISKQLFQLMKNELKFK